MADPASIAKYWSSPPYTTKEELFEQAGLRGLITHKGMSLTWPFTAELEQWEEFEAEESDIWVASLPRSGTTWTQEIVHSLLHLHRMDEADNKTLSEAFPFFEMATPGNDNKGTLAAIEALPRPRTIKTHFAYDALPESVKDAESRIIYVCRNPKDVAVEYYQFIRSWSFVEAQEEYKFEDFLQSLMDSKLPFTPFTDHLLGYWQQRHEPNVLILKYEDMMADIRDTIRVIAAFLDIASKDRPGRKLSEQDVELVAERSSFMRMKESKHANIGLHKPELFRAGAGSEVFMPKASVGDWRNYFDDGPICRRFNQWIGDQLLVSGLVFDDGTPQEHR